MEGQKASNPAPSVRLPHKEGLSSLCEKLGRLNHNLKNFQDHLYPSATDTPSTVEEPSPNNFGELLDFAHTLADRAEDKLSVLRGRF
jgi:hypothetical protein